VRRINVTATRAPATRSSGGDAAARGSFFDSAKLQLSKQRIDKTGYFSEVEVETPPVPGTTDEVDVNVRVKEKPTGAFLLGVASRASTADSAGLGAAGELFRERKHRGFQIASGSSTRSLALVHQPYYTVDG